MEFVRIPKPKNSFDTNTIFSDHLLRDLLISPTDEMKDAYRMTEDPVYLYWDKVKYKITLKNCTPEQFWGLMKTLRKARSETTPIKTSQDEHFSWVLLDRFNEFFHTLDLQAGGSLFSSRGDITDDQQHRYISRGIIEEAIASSQLEGAHTSRKVAKQMIHEGRKPRNKSEQMILNNYHAMEALQHEYKDKKLSFDLLCEMHRMITIDTLHPHEAGTLDTDEDRVMVKDANNNILHKPPKIEFVRQELTRLIDLANGDLVPPHFVHPVAIAIMLHFWLAYLHPFSDGNGRLSRLLFYWYLLKHDYWAFAYLPISSMIKQSSAQYKNAYLYTEQDDNDLTYFIDYNVRVIQRAIEDFRNYVNRQRTRNASMANTVKTAHRLNERQVDVLVHYFGDGIEDKRTQTKIYQKIYNISFPTASNDLKELVQKGFLEKKKVGKNVYYYPTAKIGDLLTVK